VARLISGKKGKQAPRYRSLILIGVVCVLLAAAGVTWLLTRDNSGSSEPDPPGPDISTQTPEPPPGQTVTPSPTPTQTPEPAPEPTPDPTPEPPYTGPVNPLTGLPMEEALTKNRPIAISVGNTSDALPANGVSAADIIYELPVESATRLLAIYQDITSVPKIGSIRSTRHYTAQIAEYHDAILVSIGGSPLGLIYVRDRRIPHIEETPGIVIRDSNRVSGRRMVSPNNAVMLGERMKNWLPERSYRIVHEDDFDLGFKFVEDGTPQNGSDAVDILLRFEAGNTSTFRYDADKKTYSYHKYGRQVVDANDNSNPAFTNLIVIRTSVSSLQGQHGGAGRREIVTTGSGEGYFICGGKYIEIDWHRVDTEPFKFTHKDGTDLEFGKGRVYIAVTPTNSNHDFK